MSKLASYEIICVIDALIGETEPTGADLEDSERYDNEVTLSEVAEHLVYRLVKTAGDSGSRRVEGELPDLIRKKAAEHLSYMIDECGLEKYISKKE